MKSYTFLLAFFPLFTFAQTTPSENQLANENVEEYLKETILKEKEFLIEGIPRLEVCRSKNKSVFYRLDQQVRVKTKANNAKSVGRKKFFSFYLDRQMNVVEVFSLE